MNTNTCILVILLTFGYLAKDATAKRPKTDPYIDKSNPYKAGSLSNRTLVLQKSDGAPMHTLVIYPGEPGAYGLLYFVPGAPAGVIPAEWYTDLLSRVASHGFIVLAVDAFYPAVGVSSLFESLPGRHVDHLKWVQENIEGHLTNDVTALTDRVALACHSAGCDVTLGMIMQNASLFNSSIFLEPFSYNIKKAKGIQLPSYMYGTQFAEEFGPFPCSLPGVDYISFFNSWGCPKWLTEVSNFGHCDVLDNFAWEACHIGHFCKTVGDWSRVYPIYHEYASGAMAAFLIGTIQGYQPTLQYIEDPGLSPLQLLKANHTLKC